MSEITRRDALVATAAGLLTLGSGLKAAPDDDTALVRLSVDGPDVFIPDGRGEFVKDDYPAGGKRVGKVKREADPADPALEKQGSPLWTHLREEVTRRAKNLPATDPREPVVVMVHGFMADPRVPFKKRPQQTDNPHDFSFHFNDAEQKHWRHTASWPLGLGLAERDLGKAGLGVAFGWNSQPDLFTDEKKLAKAVLKLVPKYGLELGRKLTEAIGEAVKIWAKHEAAPGASVGQALFDDLNEVLKRIEPELETIAMDKNFPTYNEVYARAPVAGGVLLNTVRAVAAGLPEGQSLDLICHSLGSRVVSEAVRGIATRAAAEAPAGEFKALLKRLGRVIIIGGAELSEELRKTVKAVGRAGGVTEFYNFTSAKDRVLDIFAERMFAAGKDPTPVIGLRGLEPGKLDGEDRTWAENHWFDFELDKDPVGKKWLAGRGVTAEGAHALGVLNHWFYFSSKENLRLYSLILRERDRWKVRDVRAELVAFRAANGG